jgi:hypothetical protein
MNAAQRTEVVGYLGNGSKLREAASMAEASWASFAADWTAGRRDFEIGDDSPEATFYRDAQSARSRHIASTRAEAAATAGSRESTDLLAYVRQLESEAEPLDIDTQAQPNAVQLLGSDRPAVAKAARAQVAASRDLLRALTA